MAEHPIQDLMRTAMESIKNMVDVNIIIGDTVETPDGTVIIPVSKVSFGFAAGGSDHSFSGASGGGALPFGGGSGAGVSVKPIGFLICAKDGGVRFMPVETSATSDRLMEMVPWVFDKVGRFLDKNPGKENKPQPEDAPAEKEDGAGL